MLSDTNVQIAVVWTGLAVAFGFALGVVVTRWWLRQTGWYRPEQFNEGDG